jgi:hypothetical protein
MPICGLGHEDGFLGEHFSEKELNLREPRRDSSFSPVKSGTFQVRRLLHGRPSINACVSTRYFNLPR